MNQAEYLLIRALADLIITTSTLIKDLKDMSAEDKKALRKELEAKSDILKAKIEAH